LGGQKNQTYDHTLIFENDFPAVLPPNRPIASIAPHPLLAIEPVQGSCDVLVFHPRHDLTIARLPVDDIEKIVEEWIQVYRRRGKQDGIKYVQIFEVRSHVVNILVVDRVHVFGFRIRVQ
jgi:UDPglucose--hexose-1-phosphate uridylyltransferase